MNGSVLLSRLVVPNKGYSSLDQSPDEKPLVALDTDRFVLYLLNLLLLCCICLDFETTSQDCMFLTLNDWLVCLTCDGALI